MNDGNLRPVRSESEARELGRKGGIASGEARRRRKAFAEAFDVLLAKEIEDKNGNKAQGVEAIAVQVFREALGGDLKAVQFIRDTVGEAPTQRVESVTIPQEVYDEMDRLMGFA